MSGLFTYHYLLAQANTGGIVTFTLSITETGEYQLYAYYPESDGLATKTPVSVHSGSDSTELDIDQTANGNWVRLGHWHFDANNANTVTFSVENANGPVVVDSVAYLLKEAG